MLKISIGPGPGSTPITQKQKEVKVPSEEQVLKDHSLWNKIIKVMLPLENSHL